MNAATVPWSDHIFTLRYTSLMLAVSLHKTAAYKYIMHIILIWLDTLPFLPVYVVFHISLRMRPNERTKNLQKMSIHSLTSAGDTRNPTKLAKSTSNLDYISGNLLNWLFLRSTNLDIFIDANIWLFSAVSTKILLFFCWKMLANHTSIWLLSSIYQIFW